MELQGLKKTHLLRKTLHSTFGEYFGRVIYDGIWVGKDSTIPNVNGIRLDVIEGCREAGIAAFRWPGGCCADHYHWMDGVGSPRWDRLHFLLEKERRNWKNDFGTDEFIAFCHEAGMEPIITANTATGTVDEFLSWYEYCNGDVNTKYGHMRAENGHPEPYNVNIWGIGNTDENAWHGSSSMLCDYRPYAVDYLHFTACTLRDCYAPDLRFVGLGMSIRHGMRGWVEGCLDYITDLQTRPGPHYLSVHHYIGSAKNIACGPAVDYTDEEYQFSLDSLEQYQKDIEYHREVIRAHTNPAYPTYISFDEWGFWHEEATMENDQNQRQTMRDALFAAMALHIFYRNSDIVHLAMQTQISNLLHSLFETDGARFFKTPTFYVMKMFREHLEQYLLDLPHTLEGGQGELIASAAEEGDRITITILNRDLYDACRVTLPEICREYRITASDILTAPSVRDTNSFDDPFVIRDDPFVSDINGFTLPPYSIVRLVLEKETKI